MQAPLVPTPLYYYHSSSVQLTRYMYNYHVLLAVGLEYIIS